MGGQTSPHSRDACNQARSKPKQGKREEQRRPRVAPRANGRLDVMQEARLLRPKLIRPWSACLVDGGARDLLAILHPRVALGSSQGERDEAAMPQVPAARLPEHKAVLSVCRSSGTGGVVAE